MLALRAWLDEDDAERRSDRRVYHREGQGGHFGYFRLLLDLVDGKLRQTAEEEMTGEADCVIRRCRRGRRCRAREGGVIPGLAVAGSSMGRCSPSTAQRV